MVCIQVVAIIVVVWIALKLLKHRPNPLYGHYTQKGSFHTIKKLLAYLYLKYVRNSKRPFHQARREKDDVLIDSDHEQLLENQKRRDKNAIDSVLITGVDSDGRNALVVRFDRRPDRKAEVWLYLKLASGRQYQLPIHPDTHVYNTNGRTFSAAGLTLEVLEPLKRWRVTFNGVLREGIRTTYTEDEVDTVNVKFNFIWTRVYAPFDVAHNVNAKLMADAIATEKWRPEFFKKFRLQDNERYLQWGHLHGTVSIDRSQEPIPLRLRGLKTKVYGTQDWRHIHRYANFILYCHDGSVIHLRVDSKKPFLTHVLSGHVVCSRSIYEEIRRSNLSLPHFAENENDIPAKICIDLKTDNGSYHLHVTIDPQGFVVYEGDDWELKVYVRTIRADVNGVDASGTLELGYRNMDGCALNPRQSTPFLEESDLGPSECLRYTLPLSDIQCTTSKLVGGKGMSLALLKTSLTEGDFTVPTGLCVTVAAYWFHLKQNSKISEAVKSLEDVAWKNVDGDLQEECLKTVTTVSRTPLSEDLKKAIEKELNNVFDKRFGDVQLAVRSSAIGEDNEEMSAAGQNKTFLGVKGLSELWKAITKCWASQFSFIAVEYKRRNCQPIDQGMGVVIQEMVPAEVAGVLFTVDPLTGCADKIVINANYGLGESVVSAVAEPDTIHLRRTWYDKIEIEQKQLGSKGTNVTMNDNGGIVQKETSEEAKTKCCLSDDDALRLGHLGLLLERAFGCPRDIEFAIHQDRIYLLQSRAITSFIREDDYQIVHELDDAIFTENEILTKGNVGEVFPGATSPLTLSFIPDILNHLFENTQQYPRRFQSGSQKMLLTNSNHVFIDIEVLFTVGVEETLGISEESIFITVFGTKSILNDWVHQKVLRRYGVRTTKKTLVAMFPFIKMLFGQFREMSKKEEYLKNCQIDIEDDDNSFQIFNKIIGKKTALKKCFRMHILASELLSVGSNLLMSILTYGAKEVQTSHTSDLSGLIGFCGNVVSATIPSVLKEIADKIRCSEHAEHFSTMTTQSAVLWLRTDESKIGQMFRQFLLDHRHRCIKEFDLYSIPWGEDPTVIVITLQNFVKSDLNKTSADKNRQVLSVDESLEKIQTQLPKLTKQILRWILPKIRECVRYREIGKSTCIKSVDILRQAYRRLAAEMVSEGRLPDPQLIFFLTTWELDQFLRTRSSRLLNKAIRRRDMQPKLEALQFPDFILSVPQPIKNSSQTHESERISTKLMTNFVLKATGASQGIVEGTARIVPDISKANNIQAGDILITYSTDIGWTPYFPLLSGVVTEIGGIISHGAIVARECGLPCLISAKDATHLFKSGDRVLLDGYKGTLVLLSRDD